MLPPLIATQTQNKYNLWGVFFFPCFSCFFSFLFFICRENIWKICFFIVFLGVGDNNTVFLCVFLEIRWWKTGWVYEIQLFWSLQCFGVSRDEGYSVVQKFVFLGQEIQCFWEVLYILLWFFKWKYSFAQKFAVFWCEMENTVFIRGFLLFWVARLSLMSFELLSWVCVALYDW